MVPQLGVQPPSTRAKKAEASLAKYKKKMESYADLRSKTVELEKQNQVLLARALEAEETCESIPSLERQLEQYKEAMTEAQIKASELGEALAEKAAEALRLRHDMGSLQQTHFALKDEADRLAIEQEIENVDFR